MLDVHGVAVPISPKGCHAIVETAHVLLAAGCPTGKASVYQGYEDIRFDELLLLVYTCMSDLREIHNYTTQLKRIAEFFKLLVLHEITTRQCVWYKYILYEVTNLTQKRHAVIDMGIESYNVVMDIWVDIYRCLLLSGGPSFLNTDGLRSPCYEHEGYTLYFEEFISGFIEIVGRSPQCSRSMRLIHLILGALNVNGVNRLKDVLKTRQKSMSTSITDEARAYVDNTLEWMEGVQPQIRLQHLARTCVHRAMKHRSLQDAAALGLPVHLQQYVLLLDE